MSGYLDEIQARADAATDGPWAAIERAPGDVYIAELGMYGVAWDEPAEWHDSDEASLADADFIAHARTDVPRLVAALRAVEALCAEADAAHEKYLAGVILDRFIVPANVTTERIRTAIRDALEAR